MAGSDKSQELLSAPSLGARRPLSSPAGTVCKSLPLKSRVALPSGPIAMRP